MTRRRPKQHRSQHALARDVRIWLLARLASNRSLRAEQAPSINRRCKLKVYSQCAGKPEKADPLGLRRRQPTPPRLASVCNSSPTCSSALPPLPPFSPPALSNRTNSTPSHPPSRSGSAPASTKRAANGPNTNTASRPRRLNCARLQSPRGPNRGGGGGGTGRRRKRRTRTRRRGADSGRGETGGRRASGRAGLASENASAP